MKGVFFSQIRVLASNVWREAVRDRMVYVLSISGVILLFTSLVLGVMAIGGRERIVQSTGFWVLGIWGLLAVMYLGSNVVKEELQRKTVYMVLSRPVSRHAFMLGKFAGMFFVLLTQFCLLSMVWLALMVFSAVPLTTQCFWTLVFIFGEWVLLASISLFFASFTSPLLHNFFLVGVTFLGHWSNDLRIFADNAQSLLLKHLLKTIYYVLPNLDVLNFRVAAIYNEKLSPALLWEGAGVLFGWIFTFLIAANLIFALRKLY